VGVTIDQTWLWLAGAVTLGVAGLLAWVIVAKGRPFTTGDVLRASRWSAGKLLFPTQVAITKDSVVQYQPKWVGHDEEVIHIAHVSSVKIATGVVLADIDIETSGGSDPISCHGHLKGDAVKMKALIEQYQGSYYRNRPV